MEAFFRVWAVPNDTVRRLRLRGLDPNEEYMVKVKKGLYGGAELMYKGIALPGLNRDYKSAVWKIKAKIKR